MTVRRQERKVADDLLKRELLLWLRAEYHATPVRSRPATDDFRRRARGLLLRLQRTCGAALSSLMAELRRERLRIEQASTGASAGLVAGLRWRS